jgi:hypothetical protein
MQQTKSPKKLATKSRKSPAAEQPPIFGQMKSENPKKPTSNFIYYSIE